MENGLIYGTYAAVGLLALAVWWALPKEGHASRRPPTLVLTALALGGLVVLLGRLLGESSGQLYFCLLSMIAVFGAVRVVTHAKPVYSALYFIVVALSTAGLMVLAGAEFLAAALVIIYAGAILVTYVFVIMMAQQPEQSGGGFSGALGYDRSARRPGASVLVGFMLTAVLAGVIVSRPWPDDWTMTASPGGNTLAVGKALLLDGGFPVSLQLAGVLLMVAMIGAIVIARKRLPRLDEREEAAPPGEIGRHVPPF